MWRLRYSRGTGHGARHRPVATRSLLRHQFVQISPRAFGAGVGTSPHARNSTSGLVSCARDVPVLVVTGNGPHWVPRYVPPYAERAEAESPVTMVRDAG